MPVVGEFHQQYWAVSDTFVPPPIISGGGGYPLWQASVIATSLPFGPFGAWWDVMRARIAWWWTLVLGVRSLSFNKRASVKALVDRLVSNAPPPKPDVITQTVERIIEKPVEVVRVERVIQTAPPSALEQRIQALDPERQAVLQRSLTLLESPHYVTAQKAVRETATTLGFDRPEAWKDLARHMKADLGRTQNVYRHLKAMSVLRAQSHSTFTNPEANFLTELAYQGFAAKGQ